MPEHPIGRGSKVYVVQRTNGAVERVRADHVADRNDRLEFMAWKGEPGEDADVVATYKTDEVVKYYKE